MPPTSDAKKHSKCRKSSIFHVFGYEPSDRKDTDYLDKDISSINGSWYRAFFVWTQIPYKAICEPMVGSIHAPR